MRPVTPEQTAAIQATHDRWLDWTFTTRPANRKFAEEAVRFTYRTAGVPEPQLFVWFEDLLEALLALEQLTPFDEGNWRLPEEAMHLREQVQRRVRGRLGLRTWKQVLDAIGPRHTPNRYEQRRHQGYNLAVAVPRKDSLQAGLPTTPDDPPSDFTPIEHPALAIEKAARAWHRQLEELAAQSVVPGVSGHGNIACVSSVFQDYFFRQLFRHDCLLHIWGQRDSAAYDGLIRTMQHAGPWWAFANAAILCERPCHIDRDSDGRAHSTTGPAVAYRSGLAWYAWHGTWVPPEAITQPYSLTRDAIAAQPSQHVRNALIDIYGAERYKSERRPPPRRAPRSPLFIELPDDPAKKIEVLRTYGPMPYYDRYIEGEHRLVWHELYSLGDRVRDARYSADALAVACATMARVRTNLTTVLNRLAEIGFEFSDPYAPPELGLRHRLGRLEKDAGELPLSLRAWYEVVGSVSLKGLHPLLSHAEPLVVVPFSQVLRAWDESPFDIGLDGRPFVAEIGPYRITLPSIGMDAPLENQRTGTLFVDYLRLAFQWGGFPGFAGAARPPREIQFLREGLLDF